MQDDFDDWNELKKQLAAGPPPPSAFPKSGEVWICALGHNIGREQNGGGQSFSRPVLIVHKFNNEMFWVVPLSSKQKRLDFYFNYEDPRGEKVAAILAQLRLLSIHRLHRNMYDMPAAIFARLLVRLRFFLS